VSQARVTGDTTVQFVPSERMSAAITFKGLTPKTGLVSQIMNPRDGGLIETLFCWLLESSQRT
jgi:hypothetical protein